MSVRKQGLNSTQIAEQNLKIFQTWAAGKSDSEFRAMASRGVLSRVEIVKECLFAKSVLSQNEHVAKALRILERGLRERGVLPALVHRDPEAPTLPLFRESGRSHAAQDADRLRRLEQDNASLRAEVIELKRQLQQYAVLRDALSQTGRVPR